MASPFLTFLSGISYKLYLWHQYLANLLRKNSIPAFAGTDPHLDPSWQVRFTLTAIVLSMGVAWVISHFFERPLLKNGVSGMFFRKKVERAPASR